MRLDIEALSVESFAVMGGEPGADTVMETGDNTCTSCNLTDDDFTCANYCSSRPPGLTCYVGCVDTQ